MNLQLDHFTRTLLANLEKLGVEAPQALARNSATLREIDDAINAKPIDAVVEAFNSGRTPKQIATLAKDAAASLVYAEKLRAVRGSVAPVIEKDSRRWVRDHGDELTVAMSGPFAEAAEALTATIDVIGADPDVKSVQHKAGPVAAKAWEQRRTAEETLDTVSRVCNTLRDVGYGDRSATSVARYIASARNADDLERARHLRGAGWASLASEFELQLRTPVEAQTLAGKAHAVSASAQAEAQREANAIENAKTKREVERWEATKRKAS